MGACDGVEFVRLASAYNAYVDADALANGALANASFFQHYTLKERYRQPWVTRRQLQDRGLLDADGRCGWTAEISSSSTSGLRFGRVDLPVHAVALGSSRSRQAAADVVHNAGGRAASSDDLGLPATDSIS